MSHTNKHRRPKLAEKSTQFVWLAFDHLVCLLAGQFVCTSMFPILTRRVRVANNHQGEIWLNFHCIAAGKKSTQNGAEEREKKKDSSQAALGIIIIIIIIDIVSIEKQ